MNLKKEFGLNSPNACISGAKYQDKYCDYQEEYKAKFGVYPEFDVINKPFTACDEAVYEIYCALRKSGFSGAWYYHDLHARFNNRLKKLYNTFKKEWSTVLSINTQNLKEIPVSEHIVNNLGYRKDASGNYYEGTWNNGQLIYGMIYNSANNSLFVGKINYGKTVVFNGAYSIEVTEKRKTLLQINVGSFFIKKDIMTFYTGDGFFNYVSYKGDNITTSYADISRYKDGYLEGVTIQKHYEGDIKVWFGRYKDGVLKYSLQNIWATIWRLYTGFTFMTMYYMLKFTYGLPLIAICRIYRKKNWK